MSIPTAVPQIIADSDCDSTGAALIGTLHLLLAATAMIAFMVDAAALPALPRLAWVIFFGFAMHNLYLYAQAQRHDRAWDSRRTLWLEVGWYSAIVYVTGGGQSAFFPFYIFTMLIAAVRFGFADSARIGVASAVMFSLTGFGARDSVELVQVLLRASFLLALGYFIALWGEANLRQKRGLSLLRDISSLSNPRFGIDRTVASIMERSRVFFGADSCILVSQRPGSRRWLLRIARPEGTLSAPLADAMAPSLMAMPCADSVVFAGPLFAWMRRGASLRACDAVRRQWRRCASDGGAQVAELIGARSFISVPVRFRAGTGRVYLASSRRIFAEADALFLAQIVEQVLPVIETVHLLDRLASRAALRERRTIAHDLHDSTVQPYIGLSHTLTALRNRTAADNPLKADIDALSSMAAQVVGELRRFAGDFARPGRACDHMVQAALRRHVLQAKQFYGIDIALDFVGAANIGDRLATSVLQLGSEGISNICKHSDARRGAVRIACEGCWLRIQIENDSAAPARPFIPASLAGRSAALGGTTRVEHRAPGLTVVLIDIPV